MFETNSSQLRYPEHYERNAGFVADLGIGVIGLLSPQVEEQFLDLGCGHGKLIEKLVASGASVVALDASAEQVEGALDRGLNAHVLDATKLAFKCETAAVFLNAVLHWLKDAYAAIAGVKRALLPGGRFVGEFGGEDYEARDALDVEHAMAKRDVAIADFCPCYFPSCEDYGARLESAGFKVAHLKLFQRPKIPGETNSWLGTFGESSFNSVAVGDREGPRDEVCVDLVPDFQDADGNWSIDNVSLRFHAFLP